MIGVVASIIAAHQALVYLGENVEREEKFQDARDYAEEVGKPLLVVGGPLGTNPLRHAWEMAAHGYGDVTLDIDPQALEGAPHPVVADVRHIPYPDHYFGAAAVFHVLEHLPSVEECAKAVRELRRVADQVFVAGPTMHSIPATFTPDHKLWVSQLPDGRIRIQSRKEWEALVG